MSSKAAATLALLAASAGAGFAPTVRAMDRGFYVGGYYGSVSRSTSKEKDIDRLSSITRDLYADYDYSTVSQSPRLRLDDDSFGFLGGFRWTPNLALEAAYMDLGTLEYRSEDVLIYLPQDPPPSGTVNTRFNSELTAFAISALGIWPLTYEWEIYGRVGFALTGIEGKIRVEDTSFSDSDDSVNLLIGAGLSYTFLDVYTLRAEWQRVFAAGSNSLGSRSDIDLFSIGFVVSF